MMTINSQSPKPSTSKSKPQTKNPQPGLLNPKHRMYEMILTIGAGMPLSIEPNVPSGRTLLANQDLVNLFSPL